MSIEKELIHYQILKNTPKKLMLEVEKYYEAKNDKSLLNVLKSLIKYPRCKICNTILRRNTKSYLCYEHGQRIANNLVTYWDMNYDKATKHIVNKYEKGEDCDYMSISSKYIKDYENKRRGRK